MSASLQQQKWISMNSDNLTLGLQPIPNKEWSDILPPIQKQMTNDEIQEDGFENTTQLSKELQSHKRGEAKILETETLVVKIRPPSSKREEGKKTAKENLNVAQINSGVRERSNTQPGPGGKPNETSTREISPTPEPDEIKILRESEGVSTVVDEKPPFPTLRLNLIPVIQTMDELQSQRQNSLSE